MIFRARTPNPGPIPLRRSPRRPQPPPPPPAVPAGPVPGGGGFCLPTRAATQPMPSLRPAPVLAEQAWMCQSWDLIACSPSASHSSAGPIASARSCLFASTSSTAPRRSSLRSSRSASARASCRRPRSVESTTRKTASVALKYVAQEGRIAACPPRSQTSNVRFRCRTVSTLEPTVGCVRTTSPSCSWYSVVVFPALSRPTSSSLYSRSPGHSHPHSADAATPIPPPAGRPPAAPRAPRPARAGAPRRPGRSCPPPPPPPASLPPGGGGSLALRHLLR